MLIKNIWICLLIVLGALTPTAARIGLLTSSKNEAAAAAAEAAVEGTSELTHYADGVDKGETVARRKKSKENSKPAKRGKLHKKSEESKPVWWDTIRDEFAGYPPLEKCRRRREPPSNGARCGKKPKTCFFGNIECNESSTPETKCVCNKSTWECEEQLCPSDEERGPLEGQESPLEGQRDPSKGQTNSFGDQPDLSCPLVITNPNQCPEIPPANFGGGQCMPQQVGGVAQKYSCEYGLEKCCGKCYPSFGCSCFQDGIWRCYFTEACGSECDELSVRQ